MEDLSHLISNPGMYIFSFVAVVVAACVLNVLISALGMNAWWRGAVSVRQPETEKSRRLSEAIPMS